MVYVAGRIPESFKMDLFVIWSGNNSKKLVIRSMFSVTETKMTIGTVEVFCVS